MLLVSIRVVIPASFFWPPLLLLLRLLLLLVVSTVVALIAVVVSTAYHLLKIQFVQIEFCNVWQLQLLQLKLYEAVHTRRMRNLLCSGASQIYVYIFI